MAVEDRGLFPRLSWRKTFPAKFYSSAAHDPRGGIWIYPALSNTLLRLNESTGNTDQELSVGTVMGLDPSYSPASVVSVSKTSAGGVALVLGIQSFSDTSLPSYLAAIDVSSNQKGSPIWKFKVSDNASVNVPIGHYPIVENEAGAKRIIFNGSKKSTFFVGEK